MLPPHVLSHLLGNFRVDLSDGKYAISLAGKNVFFIVKRFFFPRDKHAIWNTFLKGFFLTNWCTFQNTFSEGFLTTIIIVIITTITIAVLVRKLFLFERFFFIRIQSLLKWYQIFEDVKIYFGGCKLLRSFTPRDISSHETTSWNFAIAISSKKHTFPSDSNLCYFSN